MAWETGGLAAGLCADFFCGGVPEGTPSDDGPFEGEAASEGEPDEPARDGELPFEGEALEARGVFGRLAAAEEDAFPWVGEAFSPADAEGFLSAPSVSGAATFGAAILKFLSATGAPSASNPVTWTSFVPSQVRK